MEPKSRTDRIYRFIIKYIEEHGRSPTIAEIAEVDGRWTPMSKSVVSRHLGKLEEQGRIRREKGIARGIKVIGQCPYCGGDLEEVRVSGAGGT